MKLKLTVTLDVRWGKDVSEEEVPEKVHEAVRQAINDAAWIYLPGTQNSQDHIISVSVDTVEST